MVKIMHVRGFYQKICGEKIIKGGFVFCFVFQLCLGMSKKG